MPRLTLADGTVGEGNLLAFHFNPGAIRGALADERALARDRKVADTKALNKDCDDSFEYFGAVGLLRWARDGILEDSVAHGWFPSRLTSRVMDPDRKRKILARMPRHRFGEPDELAAAVLFLLSPAATYITGDDFAVDGGALASGY